MPLCAKCVLPFTKDHPESNKPQIYCKRLVCINARRREQQSKTGRRYYKLVPTGVQRPLVICSEGCGRKTRNRTGKCDTCRHTILSGLDENYLSVAW